MRWRDQAGFRESLTEGVSRRRRIRHCAANQTSRASGAYGTAVSLPQRPHGTYPLTTLSLAGSRLELSLRLPEGMKSWASPRFSRSRRMRRPGPGMARSAAIRTEVECLAAPDLPKDRWGAGVWVSLHQALICRAGELSSELLWQHAFRISITSWRTCGGRAESCLRGGPLTGTCWCTGAPRDSIALRTQCHRRAPQRSGGTRHGYRGSDSSICGNPPELACHYAGLGLGRALLAPPSSGRLSEAKH